MPKIGDDNLKRNEWHVADVSIQVARLLVTKYHYAKSATNTRVYTHGLFRNGSDKCYGVAWWIPPTKTAAQASWDNWKKVLTLTRLVVMPGVPKNACSFLLAGSVKMIDRKAWECLITYADTMRNHTGNIYRASNWQYTGLTAPETVFTDRHGRMMGRKRGQRTLTVEEMEREDFTSKGKSQKHKFKLILT